MTNVNTSNALAHALREVLRAVRQCARDWDEAHNHCSQLIDLASALLQSRDITQLPQLFTCSQRLTTALDQFQCLVLSMIDSEHDSIELLNQLVASGADDESQAESLNSLFQSEDNEKTCSISQYREMISTYCHCYEREMQVKELVLSSLVGMISEIVNGDEWSVNAEDIDRLSHINVTQPWLRDKELEHVNQQWSDDEAARKEQRLLNKQRVKRTSIQLTPMTPASQAKNKNKKGSKR